jgi:hypothetical protein
MDTNMPESVMDTKLHYLIPVFPSANIARDVAWYEEKTGFIADFYDEMYAVLRREHLCLHLQWHADTDDDPLLGGSVMRVNVWNVLAFFEEFVQRGTVRPDDFKANTAWQTNEFGFYDLNRNAIFIMENIA